MVSDRTILHSIESNEFLDSPEFESSRGAGDTKFRVRKKKTKMKKKKKVFEI